METFLGTIAGILFGGLISFLVSRFYYKKSIKTKTLSCYVQYVSEILTDIDPEVKQKLEIDYEGQKVDSLYQVQFIIANTGDFPIRDIIRPLTLQVPNKAEVLDANIIHIEPNGREILHQTIKTPENNFVEFTFPLLNSGDYFVVKLLVKGNAPRPEKKAEENDDITTVDFFEFRRYNLFKFKVTVDDLPPEIISERLPNDYSEFRPTTFDKTSLIAGGIISLIGFIFGFILYSLKGDLFLFNFGEFFTSFSFLKLCIILGWLLTLIILIIAVAIPASEFSGSRTNKSKTKFKLPRKLDEHRGIRYLG
jgi:hypothetical protein